MAGIIPKGTPVYVSDIGESGVVDGFIDEPLAYIVRLDGTEKYAVVNPEFLSVRH